jgi:hypothetical protein
VPVEEEEEEEEEGLKFNISEEFVQRVFSEVHTLVHSTLDK